MRILVFKWHVYHLALEVSEVLRGRCLPRTSNSTHSRLGLFVGPRKALKILHVKIPIAPSLDNVGWLQKGKEEKAASSSCGKKHEWLP